MKKFLSKIGRISRVIFKAIISSVIVIFVLLFFAELFLRIIGHSYQKKIMSSYKDFDPKNINVLCLGESTTAGLWVDPEDSYPLQLEKKLRNFYNNHWIKIIVPPHIGQNTSQISNRVGRYIDNYNPRLIILMAGINNEWSLGESSIYKFLGLNSKEKRKVKLLIFMNDLRVFKALRYLFIKFKLKFPKKFDHTYFNPDTVLGQSDYWRYPPEDWIYKFAISNKDAFVKGWKHDIKNIIKLAKRKNVNVLLMTYHSRIPFLPENTIESFAKEQNVYLVRNDLSFDALNEKEILSHYILEKDNWHPNKLGYEIIAENAFQQIKNHGLLGIIK